MPRACSHLPEDRQRHARHVCARQPCRLSRRSLARAQASSASKGRQSSPAAAVAMREPASDTPSFRKRSRNGSRKPGSRVHAAKSATGAGISCTYRSCKRSRWLIQRRPRPGSMTWTHRPSRRHTTTKWVRPRATLTTTRARQRLGLAQKNVLDPASSSARHPGPASWPNSSSVSMDDPSTEV